MENLTERIGAGLVAIGCEVCDGAQHVCQNIPNGEVVLMGGFYLAIATAGLVAVDYTLDRLTENLSSNMALKEEDKRKEMGGRLCT
ncbi:MAG: hypothetical protein Q8N88_04060 [Nanoarchaeota archaeon]|nr:hypothetical protein [Nanoarchaeota archaeon]